MSAVQSGSRRQSARLQQQDNYNYATNDTSKAKAQNNRKRKGAFEEDDDGFVFTRTKNRKTGASIDPEPESKTDLSVVAEVPAKQRTPKNGKIWVEEAPSAQDQIQQPPKERRKRRMSFSTPAKKESQPIRRSKRLSIDAEDQGRSPFAKKEPPPVRSRKGKVEKPRPPAPRQPSPEQKSISAENPPTREYKLDESTQPQQKQNEALPPADLRVAEQEESHSSTKISLPFADTPVISRNKAMREGKTGKNERRSSLGLRGRRASSLIDSGTSNGKLTPYLETV